MKQSLKGHLTILDEFYLAAPPTWDLNMFSLLYIFRTG